MNFVQDTAGIAQLLTYKGEKYTTLNPRLSIVENNEIVLVTIYGASKISSELIANLIKALGLTNKEKN